MYAFLNAGTSENERVGSFEKCIFNVIFLPNFSESFFTCQRSICSGVGTKLRPLLKILNLSSVMFRQDKLNTLSEVNLPFIRLLSSSISPGRLYWKFHHVSNKSCSVTFKADGILSMIKLGSIPAKSVNLSSFSVPS